MQNCFKCLEEGVNTTQFSIVSKTFYKLKEVDDILCFRHWYQMGKPSYDIKNDYKEVIEYISRINKPAKQTLKKK